MLSEICFFAFLNAVIRSSASPHHSLSSAHLCHIEIGGKKDKLVTVIFILKCSYHYKFSNFSFSNAVMFSCFIFDIRICMWKSELGFGIGRTDHQCSGAWPQQTHNAHLYHKHFFFPCDVKSCQLSLLPYGSEWWRGIYIWKWLSYSDPT